MSDCYLPRLGGIEVQVDDLAHHLREAGHDVRVATATPGPETPGVVRLLPPVRLPVPINPWAGADLRDLMAQAEVVHVHLGIVAPFASMAATRATRMGLPTVVTWHSMFGALTPLLRYAEPWRRWVRGGAVPTAVGRAAADQVERATGSVAPVQVLPNGIEVADWAAPAPPPGGGPVQVACAIRFARRKRPLAVLDMVHRMRDELAGEVDVQVVVAGDGPLLAPMREVVRRQGWADWLHLPGRLPRPELARRYHHSHLYLSPARLESFGIAALEARTAGLPVAGLEGSGIGEFVEDGVSGVLAPDDDALVTRVVELVRDRPLLDRIAGHNRTTPPAQAWPAVVEATVSTYEQARGRRAAAPRD
ncbi:glycosyltransferase involved in cell wall biosynthesis [Ornithinicoccus hortensis]|uniref:D-inositol 3-phosphate glycosyltransferase n=1 Tax=Ornithinicoccus hortensis TaxID=82346 RepID=A0A542YQ37_9MICO|nr:glycosyltransferase involved in cell wall biosynthesis [Ornithinicoccus hortensis]